MHLDYTPLVELVIAENKQQILVYIHINKIVFIHTNVEKIFMTFSSLKIQFTHFYKKI